MVASLATVPAAEAHRARLAALQKKVLWLASWTIHNANHVRPNADGLKVGGHQASSASLATLMTALYFDVLKPEDRVAVKPHASPVFHAIQYLLGQQTREKLEDFRSLGGAQSYPSRTKDTDDVDFSTGSVGLGVAMTLFAAMTRDYVAMKEWGRGSGAKGRMVALMGDAELDEGNVYEALLEGWKHDVRNLWWVIDYNRQSLDSVVSDRLFSRIDGMFENFGWRVVTLKYGRKQEAVFARPGGEAIRRWIDETPNSLYSALVFQGGAAWRRHLTADIGQVPGVAEILAAHDDQALADVMTNLAGHDLDAVLDAFHAASADDVPTVFIAYTIKGAGLPFAGHKDNHAGLMNPEQMAGFKAANGIADGEEWERFAGLGPIAAELPAFLADVPFTAEKNRRRKASHIPVPAVLDVGIAGQMSTQEGFGKILGEASRREDAFAQRIVTTSPDVTVSTNLGAWVNRRGIFDRHVREDVFKEQKVVSAQRWAMSPEGQHVELGIAENNLFLNLAALGLAHDLFGERLLPVGTLYDPFIARGLDALNYACYQEARFLLVATPSGLTLAPEGGAHQSIGTPLIGMAQDGLATFEPTYVDELAVIMRWAFDYMQRDGADIHNDWVRDRNGGSVYLRLSTRPVDQPKRAMTATLRDAILAGGYWIHPPAPGAELAIVYSGAVAPEAEAAFAAIREDLPGAGLLAVTSADRLNAGWHAAQQAQRMLHPYEPCLADRLLAPLSPDAALVTVLDGHPATLSWLGGVRGHRVRPLGVEHFGQSGTIAQLYAKYGIDADAIVDACAAALVDRARGRP